MSRIVASNPLCAPPKLPLRSERANEIMSEILNNVKDPNFTHYDIYASDPEHINSVTKQQNEAISSILEKISTHDIPNNSEFSTELNNLLTSEENAVHEQINSIEQDDEIDNLTLTMQQNVSFDGRTFTRDVIPETGFNISQNFNQNHPEIQKNQNVFNQLENYSQPSLEYTSGLSFNRAIPSYIPSCGIIEATNYANVNSLQAGNYSGNNFQINSGNKQINRQYVNNCQANEDCVSNECESNFSTENQISHNTSYQREIPDGEIFEDTSLGKHFMINNPPIKNVVYHDENFDTNTCTSKSIHFHPYLNDLHKHTKQNTEFIQEIPCLLQTREIPDIIEDTPCTLGNNFRINNPQIRKAVYRSENIDNNACTSESINFHPFPTELHKNAEEKIEIIQKTPYSLETYKVPDDILSYKIIEDTPSSISNNFRINNPPIMKASYCGENFDNSACISKSINFHPFPNDLHKNSEENTLTGLKKTATGTSLNLHKTPKEKSLISLQKTSTTSSLNLPNNSKQKASTTSLNFYKNPKRKTSRTTSLNIHNNPKQKTLIFKKDEVIGQKKTLTSTSLGTKKTKCIESTSFKRNENQKISDLNVMDDEFSKTLPIIPSPTNICRRASTNGSTNYSVIQTETSLVRGNENSSILNQQIPAMKNPELKSTHKSLGNTHSSQLKSTMNFTQNAESFVPSSKLNSMNKTSNQSANEFAGKGQEERGFRGTKTNFKKIEKTELTSTPSILSGKVGTIEEIFDESFLEEINCSSRIEPGIIYNDTVNTEKYLKDKENIIEDERIFLEVRRNITEDKDILDKADGFIKGDKHIFKEDEQTVIEDADNSKEAQHNIKRDENIFGNVELNIIEGKDVFEEKQQNIIRSNNIFDEDKLNFIEGEDIRKEEEHNFIKVDKLSKENKQNIIEDKNIFKENEHNIIDDKNFFKESDNLQKFQNMKSTLNESRKMQLPDRNWNICKIKNDELSSVKLSVGNTNYSGEKIISENHNRDNRDMNKQPTNKQDNEFEKEHSEEKANTESIHNPRNDELELSSKLALQYRNINNANKHNQLQGGKVTSDKIQICQESNDTTKYISATEIPSSLILSLDQLSHATRIMKMRVASIVNSTKTSLEREKQVEKKNIFEENEHNIIEGKNIFKESDDLQKFQNMKSTLNESRKLQLSDRNWNICKIKNDELSSVKLSVENKNYSGEKIISENHNRDNRDMNKQPTNKQDNEFEKEHSEEKANTECIHNPRNDELELSSKLALQHRNINNAIKHNQLQDCKVISDNIQICQESNDTTKYISATDIPSSLILSLDKLSHASRITKIRIAAIANSTKTSLEREKQVEKKNIFEENEHNIIEGKNIFKESDNLQKFQNMESTLNESRKLQLSDRNWNICKIKNDELSSVKLSVENKNYSGEKIISENHNRDNRDMNKQPTNKQDNEFEKEHSEEKANTESIHNPRNDELELSSKLALQYRNINNAIIHNQLQDCKVTSDNIQICQESNDTTKYISATEIPSSLIRSSDKLSHATRIMKLRTASIVNSTKTFLERVKQVESKPICSNNLSWLLKDNLSSQGSENNAKDVKRETIVQKESQPKRITTKKSDEQISGQSKKFMVEAKIIEKLRNRIIDQKSNQSNQNKMERTCKKATEVSQNDSSQATTANKKGYDYICKDLIVRNKMIDQKSNQSNQNKMEITLKQNAVDLNNYSLEAKNSSTNKNHSDDSSKDVIVSNKHETDATQQAHFSNYCSQESLISNIEEKISTQLTSVQRIKQDTQEYAISQNQNLFSNINKNKFDSQESHNTNYSQESTSSNRKQNHSSTQDSFLIRIRKVFGNENLIKNNYAQNKCDDLKENDETENIQLKNLSESKIDILNENRNLFTDEPCNRSSHILRHNQQLCMDNEDTHIITQNKGFAIDKLCEEQTEILPENQSLPIKIRATENIYKHASVFKIPSFDQSLSINTNDTENNKNIDKSVALFKIPSFDQSSFINIKDTENHEDTDKPAPVFKISSFDQSQSINTRNSDFFRIPSFQQYRNQVQDLISTEIDEISSSQESVVTKNTDDERFLKRIRETFGSQNFSNKKVKIDDELEMATKKSDRFNVSRNLEINKDFGDKKIDDALEIDFASNIPSQDSINVKASLDLIKNAEIDENNRSVFYDNLLHTLTPAFREADGSQEFNFLKVLGNKMDRRIPNEHVFNSEKYTELHNKKRALYDEIQTENNETQIISTYQSAYKTKITENNETQITNTHHIANKTNITENDDTQIINTHHIADKTKTNTESNVYDEDCDLFEGLVSIPEKTQMRISECVNKFDGSEFFESTETTEKIDLKKSNPKLGHSLRVKENQKLHLTLSPDVFSTCDPQTLSGNNIASLTHKYYDNTHNIKGENTINKIESSNKFSVDPAESMKKKSKAKKAKTYIMEISNTPVKVVKTKQKKLTEMLEKKELMNFKKMGKGKGVAKKGKDLKQSHIDFSKVTKKFFKLHTSQLNKKDFKFEILNLGGENIEDVKEKVISGRPYAVAFNIIFKEGFCQLSKSSSVKAEGTPEGILLGFYWTVSSASYYYLEIESGQKGEEIVNLFAFLLGPGVVCARLCFGSKTLFRNLLGPLGVPFRCIKGSPLRDPLIGCGLVVPEGQVSSFGDVQDVMAVRDRFTVTASDVLVNACHMMAVLLKVDDKLMFWLKREDMDEVFLLDMMIVPVIADMEHRGVKVNTDRPLKLDERLKECAENALTVAPLTTLLRDDLKLDAERIKSTDSGVIKFPRPVLLTPSSHVLQLETAKELMGHIKRDSEEIGRDLDLGGGDVVLTARAKFVLLALDLRNLDMRIMAQLSRDENLLETINQWMASGRDQRDISEEPVRAVLLYPEPKDFAGLLGIAVEEARSIINGFSAKFPGLLKFRSRLIRRCKKLGYVTSISGRRRRFHDIHKLDDSTKKRCERDILEFIMKASTADVRKSLMAQLTRNGANSECHLLLDAGDELVWEVDSDHLQEAAGIIKRALSDVGALFRSKYDCNGFTIPVMLSTGTNSAQMRSLII